MGCFSDILESLQIDAVYVLIQWASASCKMNSVRLPDSDAEGIPKIRPVRQDDYSLDGKTATRNEVFNLLESCGFTKLCAQCKGFETEPRLFFLESLSGASGLHMFQFQLYNSRRTPEIDLRFE